MRMDFCGRGMTDRVLRKPIEMHCRPARRFHQGCVPWGFHLGELCFSDILCCGDVDVWCYHEQAREESKELGIVTFQPLFQCVSPSFGKMPMANVQQSQHLFWVLDTKSDSRTQATGWLWWSTGHPWIRCLHLNWTAAPPTACLNINRCTIFFSYHALIVYFKASS